MKLVKRVFFVGVVSALAAIHCGRDGSKDDDESTAPSGELPQDWDGTTDWQGSSWRVVDE